MAERAQLTRRRWRCPCHPKSHCPTRRRSTLTSNNWYLPSNPLSYAYFSVLALYREALSHLLGKYNDLTEELTIVNELVSRLIGIKKRKRDIMEAFSHLLGEYNELASQGMSIMDDYEVFEEGTIEKLSNVEGEQLRPPPLELQIKEFSRVQPKADWPILNESLHKFVIQLGFYALTQKYKILTTPNILALGKSYECVFIKKKHDGYKVCTKSRFD
ncbi:hypothetical protein MUK42_32685 [Musa troglodytarum]|uniref:Uncharacterized protein n=1 Tax=Musa troglodytarum TaxID=320322 RepID=A0A9E7IE03_9LILI|nr:hypothetical protein MUK42_32685 [Musa troglodytarum]